MSDELKNDMKMLAKLMCELGKKHGDIYISATHVKRSDHGSVTFGSNLSSIEYWGDDESYTKNHGLEELDNDY